MSEQDYREPSATVRVLCWLTGGHRWEKFGGREGRWQQFECRRCGERDWWASRLDNVPEILWP